MLMRIEFDTTDPKFPEVLLAIVAGLTGGAAPKPARAKAEAPAPAPAPVAAPLAVAPSAGSAPATTFPAPTTAAPQAIAPSMTAAATDTGGLDMTACKTAFTAFVQKHGPAVGKNLLMEFQVAKVADLNPANFATFIQRASA